MSIVLNDEKIIGMVSEYNGMPVSFDCILYACIQGGFKKISPALFGSAVLIGGAAGGGLAGAAGALTNDFAVLVFGGSTISFYVFNKLGTKISSRYDIPLDQLSRMKKRKFLIWNTLKLYFKEKGKIKLTISDKTVGIKKQGENVGIFLRMLNEYFQGA